ncbi:hypothetical protein OKW45_007109 [Paraburkholderia sp. WSM4175]
MGHRIGKTLVIFSAIGAALFVLQHNTHLMPNAHATFRSSRERCGGYDTAQSWVSSPNCHVTFR